MKILALTVPFILLILVTIVFIFEAMFLHTHYITVLLLLIGSCAVLRIHDAREQSAQFARDLLYVCVYSMVSGSGCTGKQ